ncbi:MAG: MMPL family transporter, partial [Solirubrobacteraceae bacterium]
LRWAVIAAWAGGAVCAAIMLPSTGTAGAGSLGALVPKDAPALTAEQISAQRFAFPLLSRTLVVVRNPHGLSLRRQAELLRLAQRLSLGHVKDFGTIAGALPLLNTLGAAPFSREHGTTALLYLYFRPSANAYRRAQVAERLVARVIGHRPGEVEGVTGESPARVTRTSLITGHLKWLELATILLVAAAIAVHFRALAAAGVTIGAVAVAYLIADRLDVQLGELLGVSVPAEVQPVLVVLVFGVVTDYSVFFLSRFRTLLAAGAHPRAAAGQAMREIAPIVAVAGTTVAAGTAGLLAAQLEFLRAFGPGLGNRGRDRDARCGHAGPRPACRGRPAPLLAPLPRPRGRRFEPAWGHPGGGKASAADGSAGGKAPDHRCRDRLRFGARPGHRLAAHRPGQRADPRPSRRFERP